MTKSWFGDYAKPGQNTSRIWHRSHYIHIPVPILLALYFYRFSPKIQACHIYISQA